LFEAFAKAAQYIVRLKSQQDAWDHLARLIISYFPAEWTAFARRDAAGGISLHHGTPPEKVDARQVLTEECRTFVAEVLDSGFLASGVVAAAAPSMTAFLPIVEEYQVKEVMLIGHRGTDPLPKELLDVYLAIAGLAGTAFERLHSEQELNRHRDHLEELVKERTAELARAAAELLRQKDLLAVTLASIGDGVIVTDALGRVTFLNGEAERLTEWSSREASGHSLPAVFRIVNANTRQPVENPVEKVLRLGTVVGLANHTILLGKDGRETPIDDSGAPIRQSAGAVQGVVLVFRDCTEQKQSQEALQRAKADAEAANEAKSRFLANMSHELRTPMNAILGMIDVALPKAIDPTVQDCLQTAKESADLLLTLLNDLLDSAKIESGKLEPESVPFSLRRMLDQITRVLSVRASEKGLYFACYVPDDTPDAVIGDRMRLHQVLLNLAGNALKFTERGEVEISLRAVEGATEGFGIRDSGLEEDQQPVPPDSLHLTSSPQSRIPNPKSSTPSVTLEFTVRDTGIGIAPSSLGLIFQPFAQADASMARRFGGTGLGLSICKNLVEMMGGRIWVESEVEKGSTFYFTVCLPLAHELHSNFEAPVAVPTVTSSPLRILLVEDNLANQKLATYILQDRGHVVEIAGDGRQAIHLTEQHSYDVILMDVQMPGMNGLEATAAIRQREAEKGLGMRDRELDEGRHSAISDSRPLLPNPQSVTPPRRVPIIAMTAHAMKADRERCLAAGMDAYLSKPIDAHETIAVVEKMAAESTAAIASLASTTSSPTEPVNPPAAIIFDPEAALNLCFNKPDLLQQMIAFFFKDADRLLPQIRAAAERGDLKEVGHLAHRLKGTLVHLGAETAREAMRRVERLHGDGQPVDAAEAVASLERECEILRAVLTEYQRTDYRNPLDAVRKP
jgi:PAS domain S-box-containing protein